MPFVNAKLAQRCNTTQTFFQTYEKVHVHLGDLLASRGITQATIQPEFPGNHDTDHDFETKDLLRKCDLMCKEGWCQSQRCCNNNCGEEEDKQGSGLITNSMITTNV